MGVVIFPTPITCISDYLNLVARLVKSLSLDTKAKASNRSVYSKSMASIIITESVEFLPLVYANCCLGCIANSFNGFFQLLRQSLEKSP